MKDFPISFELDIVKAKKSSKIKKGDHVVYGYASTFDIDSDDAQITKEALLGAKNDLLSYHTVLFNHNMDRPIGKVVETDVDDKGLLVKIVLSKEEDEIWKKVQEGTISKFSIRGRALETQWTEPNDEGVSILQITKLKLFEVSLVSVPANVEAVTLSSYISKSVEAAKKVEKGLLSDLQILAGKLSGEDKKLLEDLINLFGKSEGEKEDMKEDKELEYKLDDVSDKRPVFQLNIDTGEIELSDTQTFRKQVLKLGKWYHWAADGGVLNVTTDMVKNIVKNFKNKTIDNVSIPLTHSTDPSKNTGEVVKLVQTDDGLDAVCQIKDESIAKKIKDGLIRSVSASIDPNYMVKTSKNFVGPVLLHTALVSEPYIKGMGEFVQLGDEYDDRPVIQLENTEPTTEAALELIKKGYTMLEDIKKDKEEKEEETTEEETKEETVEKTEEETKEETKETETVETPESEETKEENKEETTEDSTEEGKTESEEKSDDDTTKQEVDLAEVDKVYDGYLKEGKVVPAQKEAFVKLLSSKKEIELSDGSQVDLAELLKSFLDAQPKIVNFDEEGVVEDADKTVEEVQTEETNKKIDGEYENAPTEVKDFYKDKLGLSDEDAAESWNHLKDIQTAEDSEKSTLFN